jgi:5-methylthioadenosine/S-adenosylhomocysteine deaminase
MKTSGRERRNTSWGAWLRGVITACCVASVAGLASAPAPAHAATLYHGALVFTLAAGAPAPAAPGHLLISDEGLVLAAGEGAEPPADTPGLAGAKRVDVSGKLILPGFVSGHSHLWQSAFRGIAPDGTLWPWIRALHRTYGQHLADGDLGAFTRHGAFDQLIHGVTTTHNHSHYLGDRYDHYVEQAEAASATPQRVIFGWVNDDTVDDATWDARIAPYLARARPAPEQPLLGLALNPVGAYRGGELLRREHAFAERHGLRIQVHYLEPAAEAAKDRERWPEMRAGGLVSERVSYAHFIHPDETILREAAAAGAAMIWNPLSNGRLGSGLPDIEAYLAAGLKVGMGEDGQASADISDPFENMRLGLYALRLRRQNAGGLQPIDILRLHTLATAQVLGVERWVGSLEPGKFADFLVVDPGRPGTGPVWDPAAHVLFAISARNLRQVFVGGREVVRDGVVPGVDLAALETEVAGRITALRARAAK